MKDKFSVIVSSREETIATISTLVDMGYHINNASIIAMSANFIGPESTVVVGHRSPRQVSLACGVIFNEFEFVPTYNLAGINVSEYEKLKLL